MGANGLLVGFAVGLVLGIVVACLVRGMMDRIDDKYGSGG